MGWWTRSRAWLTAACVVGASACGMALPVGAQAGGHNPHGRMLGSVRPAAPSVLGPRRAEPRALDTSPLLYHGGPVVHDGHVYAIFWQPPGYSFPIGYRAAVAKYFRDVAADSGKGTNVYSVNRQYYDRTGRPAYKVAFAGAYVDTAFLPASGCSNAAAETCLTDDQLQSELASYVVGKGLPRGMSRQYFLFTPPGVGTCYDGGGGACSYLNFCAYHSWFNAAGTLLYAVHPYVAGYGACDVGESPTGTSADAVLNVVSHEHNEIITDPTGGGWFDTAGEENGDKCAWSFGSMLGVPGTRYNQVIAGSRYLLQLEWSNKSSGCAARLANLRPRAAFATSGHAIVKNKLLFDASRAKDPDGRIASYRWDFGDGKHGSGKLATHAYAHAGKYWAKLTVKDDEGRRATSSAKLAVKPNPTPAKRKRKHRRHRRSEQRQGLGPLRAR